MTYRVEFARPAERQFDHLPQSIRLRLAARIQALADNPRPPGVQQLAAEDRIYRIRISDYRVIYAIEDDRLLVLVLAVGHRREVYRRH